MRIMRSTFSILFYINRGKIKADGTTAVKRLYASHIGNDFRRKKVHPYQP